MDVIPTRLTKLQCGYGELLYWPIFTNSWICEEATVGATSINAKPVAEVWWTLDHPRSTHSPSLSYSMSTLWTKPLPFQTFCPAHFSAVSALRDLWIGSFQPILIPTK